MNQYEYMSFYNICEYGHSLWVNNIVTNDLFRLEKETLRVLEMIDLNLDKFGIQAYPQYFVQTIQRNNLLYMFPGKSSGKIFIYNLETREIRCQSLGLDAVCKECDELFYEGIQYEDCLWIFPPNLEIPLLIYEFCKEEIRYDWKWNEKAQLLVEKNGSFSLYLAHYANWVYIFQKETAKIVATDLRSGSVEAFALQGESKIFSIAVDETYFWVVRAEDNCLYRYKRAGNFQKTYNLKDCRTIPWNIKSQRIIDLGDKIVALPPISEINNICIFDKTIEKAMKIPLEHFPAKLSCLRDFRKAGESYWGYKVVGRELILHPCNANMMLLINLDSGTMKGYSTFIYDEKWTDYFVKKFQEIEYKKGQEAGDFMISRYGIGIVKHILCQSEKRD